MHLYKNNFHQRDTLSAEQEAIFSRGNSVGLEAQKLYKGGVDASPPSRFKYAESLNKTKEFIEAGKKIIYEASFQFEGVYAALDILVNENEKWYACEVKSSTKITSTYIMDAALQYFVITQSGIELCDFEIIYVNSKYVRTKKNITEELFTRQSVLKEIIKLQPFIAQKIDELKNILATGIQPEIKLGEHCHTPYNCDFAGTCRGEQKPDSVFYLNGISKNNLYELYYSGIKKISDLPVNFNFNADQKIQYQTAKLGKEYIEKENINRFTSSIQYPIHFLDFELFMPAIPLYEGTSPYEHIPFLYSLHVKENKNSELEYFHFLAETGESPIKNFIENLIRDIGTNGDILVFDPTHEKKILNKAATQFPSMKKEIENIIARMKDLAIPFQKKMFYSNEMKGSYSMKTILPLLVPELKFSNLAIKNGISALTAFEKLQTESDLFKIEETRQALIEYCKMDTLGIAKIFEKLESISL